MIDEKYIEVKESPFAAYGCKFTAHYRVPGEGGIGICGTTAEEAREKLIQKLTEKDHNQAAFVDQPSKVDKYKLYSSYPQPETVTEG